MNCAATIREQFISWCVRVIVTMFYIDCQFLKSVYLKYPNCFSVNEGIRNENRYFSIVLISVVSHPQKVKKNKDNL